MIDKIKALEKAASPLEPDAVKRREVRDKIVAYTESFLSTIETDKAFQITADLGIGLLSSPISNEPITTEESIELFKENVEKPGLNPASGGHLAYIPGGGLYYSSLGDYVAAITNRYAGVFYPSPGAVRMTNMLLRWMADIAGYPKNAGGNLTSGGSIANLTAIVTARDAHKLTGKDFHKTVVYSTEHAHHCIDKALRIAGLKECIKRHVPLDENYKMDVAALQSQIAGDKKDGLKPWLIIASAGTTDVGAVDPLDEIGDVAKENGLWYHIDGAYGAFFALTDYGKQKLKGMEKSDSIVMDPHKGLFLPYGLGVLLVKDQDKLRQSHYYSANYLQDVVEFEDEISPAEVSPELTTHFRAMRMWLPLKLCGTRPFVACLDEKLLLARYFHKTLGAVKGFEMGPEPELSVVTYRYIPKSKDANEFNEALLQEVLKDGRIFLSSTTINGNFTLRIAILAFRSHLRTIDLTIDILKEKVNTLENSQ